MVRLPGDVAPPRRRCRVGGSEAGPDTAAMALIAKRRLTETWREAVAARAGEAGVAAFEARLAEGVSEVEAAYRALDALGRLWRVVLPGDPPQAAGPASPARAGDEVPVV